MGRHLRLHGRGAGGPQHCRRRLGRSRQPTDPGADGRGAWLSARVCGSAAWREVSTYLNFISDPLPNTLVPSFIFATNKEYLCEEHDLRRLLGVHLPLSAGEELGGRPDLRRTTSWRLLPTRSNLFWTTYKRERLQGLENIWRSGVGIFITSHRIQAPIPMKAKSADMTIVIEMKETASIKSQMCCRMIALCYVRPEQKRACSGGYERGNGGWTRCCKLQWRKAPKLGSAGHRPA